MAVDENGFPIFDEDTATAVAEQPTTRKRPELTQEEFQQLRYWVEQRKRMDAQNAKEGYRSMKSQVAGIDYQRPNFSSDEEYEKFILADRTTRDLRKRLDAKRNEEEGMVLAYSPESLQRLKHYENAYGKAAEEFGKGNMSAPDLERIHRGIIQGKDSVQKTWQPRPPTLKEKLQQRMTTDGRGGQWIEDAKTGKLSQVKDFFSPADVAATIKSIKEIEGENADPQIIMEKTKETLMMMVQIRASLAGDTPEVKPDPRAMAEQQAQAAFGKLITTGNEKYGEAPSLDEMTEKGRIYVQGDPNKAQEFMERWNFIYKGKDGADKVPDPKGFKIEKLLPSPPGKSFGRKIGDFLTGPVFEGKKKQAEATPDKFKVGQPAQIDGVTWKYIGNGKWSDK